VGDQARAVAELVLGPLSAGEVCNP
jgi:hypothetical protein